MSSTDVVPHQDEWARMTEIAKSVAGTEFVPQSMRGRPAAVLACILAGREIGVGPMQALQQISMISGRPTYEAELQLGCMLSKGLGSVEVLEKSTQKCVLRGTRADGSMVNTVTVTLEDAQRAGLTSKTNWKQYPRQMLWARAVSELMTQTFPDATSGVARYTPDELGSEEYVATEEIVEVAEPSGVAVEAPEIVEPEIVEPAPEPDDDVEIIFDVDKGHFVDVKTGEVVDPDDYPQELPSQEESLLDEPQAGSHIPDGTREIPDEELPLALRPPVGEENGQPDDGAREDDFLPEDELGSAPHVELLRSMLASGRRAGKRSWTEEKVVARAQILFPGSQIETLEDLSQIQVTDIVGKLQKAAG